ncbi:MAG: hypothetical protein K9L83_10350 [Deltaproteobacteria bacterium]|nr:hypothetical protein [Deltaproteobacteria bacterium]
MMDETVYQRYLSALLQGNRSQCMDVVGLSVSVYFNMAPLKRMIETVRAHGDTRGVCYSGPIHPLITDNANTDKHR